MMWLELRGASIRGVERADVDVRGISADRRKLPARDGGRQRKVNAVAGLVGHLFQEPQTVGEHDTTYLKDCRWLMLVNRSDIALILRAAVLTG